MKFSTLSSFIASVAVALIGFVALVQVVQACDTACSIANEVNGRCWYNCADQACHMSASHHRDQFLNGLSSRGYDCRPEGYGSLSCAETNNFGACAGHRWTCGAGC